MVSFFPQFLNATAAAIAAAVAIPLLLLLYFLKLRRMQVPIGSTLLWKKAIQDLQVNSPFQRLRRNLLLLLQLLALLALIFALARPVSEGTRVAGEKTVILIDRSASMDRQRDGTPGRGGPASRLRLSAEIGLRLLVHNGAHANRVYSRSRAVRTRCSVDNHSCSRRHRPGR